MHFHGAGSQTVFTIEIHDAVQLSHMVSFIAMVLATHTHNVSRL